MRKSLAITFVCCAFALMMGLVACGGGGGSAATDGSGSASSSDDAAAKQAAEAQAALDEGIRYWFGTGANGYNKEKAHDAFQKAADLGSAEAFFWLGVYTEAGVSPERFTQEADYYQKAIDAGCAKGYVGLGDLYKSGAGVEKDLAKAQELYQKAIDAGELYGYVGLAGMYEDGDNVEASGAKAIASEDFFVRNSARCGAGKIYRTGTAGVDINPEKAIEYFQAAADENYPVGWQRLGNMYSSNVYGGDFSIEENYDKAFECYSKAADGGKFINLAVQYEHGHGCEQDYAKTIELYQKEINEGTEPLAGMVCLATMYANGWGVEQDYGKALELCNEALAAANPSDDYTIDHAHEWIDWVAQNS